MCTVATGGEELRFGPKKNKWTLCLPMWRLSSVGSSSTWNANMLSQISMVNIELTICSENYMFIQFYETSTNNEQKKKHITNHYFYLKTPRILTFTLGQWFNKSWRTNCAVLEKQAWQTTQPDSLLTSVSTRMSLPRLTFTVDSNLPLIALSRSSAKVCPISVPVMTFVRCTLRGILKFKHKCFFFFLLQLYAVIRKPPVLSISSRLWQMTISLSSAWIRSTRPTL